MSSLEVLLCPAGSIGDINPQLAIGAELRRRGHRVTVPADERFTDACRNVSHEFVAVQSAAAVDALHADPRAFTYQVGVRARSAALA